MKTLIKLQAQLKKVIEFSKAQFSVLVSPKRIGFDLYSPQFSLATSGYDCVEGYKSRALLDLNYKEKRS